MCYDRSLCTQQPSSHGPIIPILRRKAQMADVSVYEVIRRLSTIVRIGRNWYFVMNPMYSCANNDPLGTISER